MYVLVIIQALEKGRGCSQISICNGCGGGRTNSNVTTLIAGMTTQFTSRTLTLLCLTVRGIRHRLLSELHYCQLHPLPGTCRYHSQASYACIRIPYSRARLFVRLLIGDPSRTSATSELRSACHIQVPAPLPLPPSAFPSLHPLPSIQALL